jgi:hypothetical protein
MYFDAKKYRGELPMKLNPCNPCCCSIPGWTVYNSSCPLEKSAYLVTVSLGPYAYYMKEFDRKDDEWKPIGQNTEPPKEYIKKVQDDKNLMVEVKKVANNLKTICVTNPQVGLSELHDMMSPSITAMMTKVFAKAPSLNLRNMEYVAVLYGDAYKEKLDNPKWDNIWKRGSSDENGLLNYYFGNCLLGRYYKTIMRMNRPTIEGSIFETSKHLHFLCENGYAKNDNIDDLSEKIIDNFRYTVANGGPAQKYVGSPNNFAHYRLNYSHTTTIIRKNENDEPEKVTLYMYTLQSVMTTDYNVELLIEPMPKVIANGQNASNIHLRGAKVYSLRIYSDEHDLEIKFEGIAGGEVGVQSPHLYNILGKYDFDKIRFNMVDGVEGKNWQIVKGAGRNSHIKDFKINIKAANAYIITPEEIKKLTATNTYKAYDAKLSLPGTPTNQIIDTGDKWTTYVSQINAAVQAACGNLNFAEPCIGLVLDGGIKDFKYGYRTPDAYAIEDCSSEDNLFIRFLKATRSIKDFYPEKITLAQWSQLPDGFGNIIETEQIVQLDIYYYFNFDGVGHWQDEVIYKQEERKDDKEYNKPWSEGGLKYSAYYPDYKKPAFMRWVNLGHQWMPPRHCLNGYLNTKDSSNIIPIQDYKYLESYIPGGRTVNRECYRNGYKIIYMPKLTFDRVNYPTRAHNFNDWLGYDVWGRYFGPSLLPFHWNYWYTPFYYTALPYKSNGINGLRTTLSRGPWAYGIWYGWGPWIGWGKYINSYNTNLDSWYGRIAPLLWFGDVNYKRATNKFMKSYVTDVNIHDYDTYRHEYFDGPEEAQPFRLITELRVYPDGTTNFKRIDTNINSVKYFYDIIISKRELGNYSYTQPPQSIIYAPGWDSITQANDDESILKCECYDLSNIPECLAGQKTYYCYCFDPCRDFYMGAYKAENVDEIAAIDRNYYKTKFIAKTHPQNYITYNVTDWVKNDDLSGYSWFPIGETVKIPFDPYEIDKNIIINQYYWSGIGGYYYYWWNLYPVASARKPPIGKYGYYVDGPTSRSVNCFIDPTSAKVFLKQVLELDISEQDAQTYFYSYDRGNYVYENRWKQVDYDGLYPMPEP